MADNVSDKEIREYLGHNGAECRVRIKQDPNKIVPCKIVVRYGSPDPVDRSKDFWSYIGTRDEVVKEMLERRAL